MIMEVSMMNDCCTGVNDGRATSFVVMDDPLVVCTLTIQVHMGISLYMGVTCAKLLSHLSTLQCLHFH